MGLNNFGNLSDKQKGELFLYWNLNSQRHAKQKSLLICWKIYEKCYGNLFRYDFETAKAIETIKS